MSLVHEYVHGVRKTLSFFERIMVPILAALTLFIFIVGPILVAMMIADGSIELGVTDQYRFALPAMVALYLFVSGPVLFIIDNRAESSDGAEEGDE